MRLRALVSKRGAVALVALCCVSVLGIAVAGYFAQSNQSMRLSNRTYAQSVSVQLAEMGLEEALRAFSTNNFADWTSGTGPNQTAVDWTISGTTATASITLPAAKYGAGGNTGAVKLRVDNYDAFQKNAVWDAATTYRVNNLVGVNGVWYRCILSHSNQAPVTPTSGSTSTAGFWVQEQMPLAVSWNSASTYRAESVVFYNLAWYRCILAPPSNQAPNDPTYWTQISVITTSVATALSNNESLLNWWSGASWSWWRRYPGNWDSSPAVSWRWRSSFPYVLGDMVDYNGIWYRCIAAHFSNSTVPSSDVTRWSSSVPSSNWSWSSATSYRVNDVVHRSGAWYRCIFANLNQGPPNAALWVNSPQSLPFWDSGKSYALNSTVCYNGTWYLCLAANFNTNPSSSSGFWASPASVSYRWNATTAYNTTSYVSFGGVWYKCIMAHTNQTPNNATYWTAIGAPVIYSEGSATLPNGTVAIKTLLRATVAPAPLFPNALAATSTLSISGAGTVDSYDASQGTYNQITPPFSSGSPNVGYSAVLAGGNPNATAVAITNTTVKGYVAAPSAEISPHAPRWTYSSSAAVTGNSSSTVDVTRVSRSPYIPQFDLSAVSGGNPLLITAGSNTTIGIEGATTPITYVIGIGLTLAGSDTLIINGPVILDVQGGITTTTGKIVITPAGSAEIRFSGALSIGGNSGGGIDNQTLDPKKLILVGSASTGTHNFDSTLPFYGAVYMPNVTNALTIGTGVVIYGALSAKHITFSSDANVRYDTSLRYARIHGVEQIFQITELRELTNPAERVVLP